MSFSIPRSISIHNLKMLSLNSNIKVKIKITGLQKKGNVENEKLSVNRQMHRGWIPCLEDIVSRSKLNQWSHGPQLTQIKGHLLIVHLIPDIYKNIQVKIKNLCRRSVIKNFSSYHLAVKMVISNHFNISEEKLDFSNYFYYPSQPDIRNMGAV